MVRLICLLTTLVNLRESLIENEDIWSKSVELLDLCEYDSLNDLLISIFVNISSKKSYFIDKYGDKVKNYFD